MAAYNGLIEHNSPEIHPFRVMTWNILASVHTHWNHASHGGSPGSVETEFQRHTRHRAIVCRINNEQADVVLLQEVDSLFLPRDWQGGALPCGSVLSSYVPYRSCSLHPQSGLYEGVAILLRVGVWTRDTRVPKVSLAKNARRGWKCGLVLHAVRCHDPEQCVCFVSVHLKHGGDAPKLNLISDALKNAHPNIPVLLGGDFNTTEARLATLQPALGGLRRVPSQPGSATCVSADMSCIRPDNVIDHMFVSEPLVAMAHCRVGPLPEQGGGPWGQSEDDGSDHAWLLATISAAGPRALAGGL